MEKWGRPMLQQIGKVMASARHWAHVIKRDVVALWLAAGDSRVPLIAKLVAGTVAAYALSPIDLIPDFIPVLGAVDDLVIVPLGILLAIRLIPAGLMTELRDLALERERPQSPAGLLFVLTLWTMIAGGFGWLAWNHFAAAP